MRTGILDAAAVLPVVALRTVATGCALAESPAWRPAPSNELLWVDCEAGTLHRRAESGHTVMSLGREELVTAVCLRDDDGLLVLAGRHILAIDPSGGHPVEVASIPDEPAGVRFNDAKPGPGGRLWAGTVAPGIPAGGALWTFHPAEGLVRRHGGVTHGNGIAWNVAGTLMYTVDSGTGVVSRAEVDAVTGLPGLFEAFFVLDREEGIPDGLAVDSADSLWLAVWGGSCVLHIDTDGGVLGKVVFDERNVTSCAFIGTDLDTLAITTAADDIDLDGPGGAVHTVDVGASGTPVGRCSWTHNAPNNDEEDTT